MSFSFDNGVIDAALGQIEGSAQLHVCELDPADRTAVVANSLATVVVDTGDFVIADHPVSGRQVTVAAQSNVPVTASGTPAHYCLIDGGTRLLAKTEVVPFDPGPPASGSPDLTEGSTVNIPAVVFSVADPVVEVA